MKKKRILISVVILVFIVTMLQLGYIVYPVIGMIGQSIIKTAGSTNDSTQPKQLKNNVDNQTANENANNKTKISETENIDISNISISKEIDDCIKKSDAKNHDKNVIHYKRLLTALKVPGSFRTEIERLIKKGYEVPDILTAYDFLNENYGQKKELEELLKKKLDGKDWPEIFTEYNVKYHEYISTDFPQGYLESLLKTPGLIADDVMISDIISQKGFDNFDELINMRKNGKQWDEINLKTGVLNMEQKVPRLALTSVQVSEQIEKTGLTQKQVIDAFAMTNKMGKDINEITGKMKAHKKKEDIYSDFYNEIYR